MYLLGLFLAAFLSPHFVSALPDCHPNPLDQWPDFVGDLELRTEIIRFWSRNRFGYQTNYILSVDIPDFPASAVPAAASAASASDPAAEGSMTCRRLTVSGRLVGPSGEVYTVGIHCDVIEGRCFGSISFPIPSCGLYILSLYWSHFPNGKPHLLGKLALRLPHYSPLIQSDRGYTWARMKFEKGDMHSCWHDHTYYNVTCGSLNMVNLGEDEPFKLDNLMPGQEYSCSYETEGSDQTWTAKIETEDYQHSNPFTLQDEKIFLRHDMVEELLSDPDHYLIKVNISDPDSVVLFADRIHGAAEVEVDFPGGEEVKACLTVERVGEDPSAFGGSIGGWSDSATWCHKVKLGLAEQVGAVKQIILYIVLGVVFGMSLLLGIVIFYEMCREKKLFG